MRRRLLTGGSALLAAVAAVAAVALLGGPATVGGRGSAAAVLPADLCPGAGGDAARLVACVVADVDRSWTRRLGKPVGLRVTVDPPAVDRAPALPVVPRLRDGLLLPVRRPGVHHRRVRTPGPDRVRRPAAVRAGDGGGARGRAPGAVRGGPARSWTGRATPPAGVVEQQADCLAGVWAAGRRPAAASSTWSAFRAVYAREMQIVSSLVPPPGSGLEGYDEVATHGTPAQRAAAFDRGVAGADPVTACALAPRLTPRPRVQVPRPGRRSRAGSAGAAGVRDRICAFDRWVGGDRGGRRVTGTGPCRCPSAAAPGAAAPTDHPAAPAAASPAAAPAPPSAARTAPSGCRGTAPPASRPAAPGRSAAPRPTAWRLSSNGSVSRSSSSRRSGDRPSSSSLIEVWWISRSRARLASSSGAARTSSSSCLIMVPIRITLAGCSIWPVGSPPSPSPARSSAPAGRPAPSRPARPSRPPADRPVRPPRHGAAAARSWAHPSPPARRARLHPVEAGHAPALVVLSTCPSTSPGSADCSRRWATATSTSTARPGR